MKSNRIDKILSSSELQQIEDGFKLLESLLDFGVQLTVQERKKLLKAGDKTLPFLEIIQEHMNQIAPYLPAYVQKDQFEKDTTLLKQLKSIKLRMAMLMDKIEDAIYVAGNEAFKEGLTIYDILKNAAQRGNVGGLEPVLAELKKRFAQARSKNEETEDTTPPTE